MTSLLELVTWEFNQNKILELVTRDFYLDYNSRINNLRFLSGLKFSS